MVLILIEFFCVWDPQPPIGLLKADSLYFHLYISMLCTKLALIMFCSEWKYAIITKDVLYQNITSFRLGHRWDIYMLLLLLFSHWAMSESLRPHGMQHSRLPCPLLYSWVFSNSCPLSQWCYLTTSSSAALFSFCLLSFPASGPFHIYIYNRLLKKNSDLWATSEFISLKNTYLQDKMNYILMQKKFNELPFNLVALLSDVSVSAFKKSHLKKYCRGVQDGEHM